MEKPSPGRAPAVGAGSGEAAGRLEREVCGGHFPDGAPRHSRRFRNAWLLLAAFGVSLALCGAETVSRGRKAALGMDQFNHMAHAVSVADAVQEGQFPPRVSPFLSGGRGNPYHQFYPPFAHAVPAALGAALGDALAGYAAAALLFTALSFAYAWKLARLLTLSDASAWLGAFTFAAGPYLLCDRALRGAWPEFTAFSLLPLALYCLLRGAGGGPFRRLLPAVAALAALFLSHLITSFLFALSLGAFVVLWSLNALSAGGRRGRLEFARLGRRSARALAAGGFAALIAACYLAPAALYDDLAMKGRILPSTRLAGSENLVPPLSLLSVTDSASPIRTPGRPARFQLGPALLISLLAYAWLWIRERPGCPRPAFALPLVFAGALAICAVLAPGAVTALFPPADIAQFSYRYLLLFALAASLTGPLALRACFPAGAAGAVGDGAAGAGGTACRMEGRKDVSARNAAVFALAAFAAVMAAPYLYPAEFMPGYPKAVSAGQIRDRGALAYGEGAYLRNPPGPEPPGRIQSDSPAVAGGGGSASRRYRADLSTAPRLPGGEVPLDVLYYPGLQEVEVRVDEREAAHGLATYWQAWEAAGDPDGEGVFHGLAISGLPRRGTLEAEVRFTGMRAANVTSAAALSAYGLLCLAAAIPLRRVRRARRARFEAAGPI